MTDAFLTDPARGCAPGKVEPDLFFSDNKADLADAKRVCRTCPVQQACDTYATGRNIIYGVWAGLNRHPHSNKQRAKKARRRQAVAA